MVGDLSDRKPPPSSNSISDTYLGVEFRGADGHVAPGHTVEVDLVDRKSVV